MYIVKGSMGEQQVKGSTYGCTSCAPAPVISFNVTKKPSELVAVTEEAIPTPLMTFVVAKPKPPGIP